MTKISDGGPAFPQSISPDGPFGGMSLRDWFAGQALAGFAVADVPLNERDGESREQAMVRVWSGMARAAYIAADAMLAAREATS